MTGLRRSTLIMLGRLVRIVQVAFPKVSIGIDERFVLVERAAFLVAVRASCYRQSGHRGWRFEPRDLFYLNVYLTKRR